MAAAVPFKAFRLACDHLFGKLLFTWLSLVMSMMVYFVLSFFPRDVLDEILKLIESVSEDFPSYSFIYQKYSFLVKQYFDFAISIYQKNLRDGWIVVLQFTSFSTVFRSYQVDGMVIMKDCVQWNLIYSCKNFRHQLGSNPGPLSVGQRLIY